MGHKANSQSAIINMWRQHQGKQKQKHRAHTSLTVLPHLKVIRHCHKAQHINTQETQKMMDTRAQGYKATCTAKMHTSMQHIEHQLHDHKATRAHSLSQHWSMRTHTHTWLQGHNATRPQTISQNDHTKWNTTILQHHKVWDHKHWYRYITGRWGIYNSKGIHMHTWWVPRVKPQTNTYIQA